MKWHPFEAGKTYLVDHILSVLESDLRSGRIKDVKAKSRLLRSYEAHRDIRVRFVPFSSGWGVSPYNPNTWQRTNGKPLFDATAEPKAK